MNNLKTDMYYLNKALMDIDFIIKNTTGLNEEELVENEILMDSIFFRLIQISENIKRLSREFLESNSSFPYYEVLGFRNRVVHDYGNIDYYIVYNTIINDIPKLKTIISNIIRCVN